MELFEKELAHLPEVPYRIFISNVNSYYAYTIIECLRTDNLTDENPNIIVGTLNPKEKNPKPRGVTRIIDVINFINKFKYHKRKKPSFSF